MSDTEAKSRKPAYKSEQFRRFAADTFGLRINNNIVQLTFALETLDENDQECRVAEATAILGLPSFKVLTIMLSSALEAIEKQVGTVELAPGKEEQLRERIEGASSSQKAE